ncbi:hypothetical protein EUZ85_13380 [Hahella sp. KA22]|uniref:hypothetical protein n=1 Tax=Hahella sp. KA22 TaxID=1628392 RepID=UPI000FDDD648|nr:hypothetical protein [Hahella sp. KA22]AZZ91667.1 hypothetical protein ENC22_10820 [Hahella sp. KA22]QAY55037.1 hypothetical protein EUZ85_13380 [Hahella sp. KA22]
MSEDFTERKYAEVLEVALSRFHFQLIKDDSFEERVAVWRHDIDFSPSRALALAKIEKQLGVKSTYYVQPSSLFYSVFDPKTIDQLRRIHELGHDLGLHFDPSIYQEQNLEEAIQIEANVIVALIGCEVASFSLHNPSTYDANSFERAVIGGMKNASYTVFRNRFNYCSDSNGIWRFTPLLEVLRDDAIDSVYVLTHPVWWQKTDMSPRDKVLRSLDGRTSYLISYYDNLLEQNNRPNIGK